MRLATLCALGLVLLWGGGTTGAQDLSGDEILARAAEVGTITAPGSRISLVDFEIFNADGTTLERRFAFFGKREEGQPDRLLIYFLAPELERGTIFLSLDPVDPAEDTRIWLYLSALGQVKELISEQDRNAGFAGSNLQNDQIGGGFDYSEDYTGELLGSEAVEVTWLGETQSRTAFKVAVTKRPEAENVDFPSGTAWIDAEAFVVLRAELVNEGGALEQVSTLDDFVEFDGRIEPNHIVVEDVLDGGRTSIGLSGRQLVDDLPDEIFDPAALGVFAPADYGVEG